MGHYLLAASALAGHVLPMVETGRHLVHGGHGTGQGARDAGLPQHNVYRRPGPWQRL
jgi:hypothetical protein